MSAYVVVLLQKVKVLQLILAKGGDNLRIFDHFDDVLSLSLEFFQLSKNFFLLLSKFCIRRDQ
jgi:hypothetical protein